MSGYVSGLVWLVGPLDRSQRNVLLAIADAVTDDKTGAAWPSIKTLANKCLFSTRYVMDAIQELENEGWLNVHRRAIKGRWTAYAVNVERLEVLRELQRKQEKQLKRSGANTSPETYVQELLALHTQVKSVHVTNMEEFGQSDEQSSPGQVKSTTSQVKPFAISGEIRDTPIKEEKRNETLSERESAPSRPDSFPAGLQVEQYVYGIFENRGVVAAFTCRDLAAQAIRVIARGDSTELHEAAAVLDQRIGAGIERGETINNFWFTDAKWKTDGGSIHGGSQNHRSAGTAAARVERSLAAWDRARAERDRGRAI